MKYVAINNEDVEGIFCFGDLYKKLGIAELSEKCGGFIRSVEQIRANKKTIEYLHKLFITNVKSSKDKGYYVNNNQSTIFVPFYTETTVDTTSSGDAFNGAYLHSVTEGYSPSESAKIASIAAGLQAQGIGAIKSVPYYDEVFKIYKNGV